MDSKYSWVITPEHNNTFSFFGFKNGTKYVVCDNNTGKRYLFPTKNPIIDDNDREILSLNDLTPPELNDEEFFNWFRLQVVCEAIRTKNYLVYNTNPEFFTPDVLSYIVENNPNENVIGFLKQKNILNSDLLIKAFKVNNDVCDYLDDFDNISGLTPDLFSKIYFESDESKRKKIIKKIYDSYSKHGKRIFCYSRRRHGARFEIISKDVADDMLSLDIKSAIEIVPIDFISEEKAIEAMNKSIHLLEYVPSKYQRPEYQKALIDASGSIAKISDDALVKETIYYAIDKRNDTLNKLRKIHKTKDICEYSVKKRPKSLRNVPKKLRTYDMCLDAVKKDPNLIILVPYEFINSTFLEKLNVARVIIPNKHRDYVRSCVKSNKKFELENINSDNQNNLKAETKIYNDHYKVELKSLEGLLSDSHLEYLENNGITTVGELLQKSQESEFIVNLLKGSIKRIKAISMAIKLLKCKYLNIDPLIDFKENKSLQEFLDEFEFSTNIKDVITTEFKSTEDFLTFLQSKNAKTKLLFLPGLEKQSVNEILLKISWVYDYYKNYKQKEKDSTFNEELELLKGELEKIRTEMNSLNAKIVAVSKIVNEAEISNKKGESIK